MISSDYPLSKSAILMIYTGGTIGMKADAVDKTLRPFDFGQILNEVPELQKYAFKIDSYTFDPLIDSSDVEPTLWVELANLIKEKYESYDGFVILHGTDTMAYTASALSFMLAGLTKPVVFTGSQLPIGLPRTDGKENLISAVEIASAKDIEGHAIVPEVTIYFDSKLLRGNRATKLNAENFNAFNSPNLPPLATAGIDIKYNEAIIRKPADWDLPLSIWPNLDTRVSILKIHPGITPQVVKDIICGSDTRAIILETYGSGNAPTRDWFLEIIKQGNELGKIIVNVTQCLYGKVNMSLYATGKSLENCGVISGADSTTESMLAKLFHLLGRSSDSDWVKKMLSKDLKGEISEEIIIVK